jgi:Ca2+/H+ antiporter, TMEM165/GDT1 family
LDALLASFLFVVLAEMGDKTQLLSMAFATRFSPYKVLIGVFLATILNHALAVLAGHYLTVFIPVEIISLIASFSFIFFGLWTLRGDKLEGEEKRNSRFGAIATVAIAFFLAEMGDKTQLATISLAIQYNNMIFVLMGTTLGMIVADSIGIGVVVVLRKRIPERVIKWFAAFIFAVFGFIGIYQFLSGRVDTPATWSILAAIALLTSFAAYRLLKRKNHQKISGTNCD